MMRIPAIATRFRASPSYRGVRRALASGDSVHASNLAGSSKAILAAAIADDLSAPVLVLTASNDAAETWATDLEALVGETSVGLFPQWEILPYEDRSPQREIEGQRLEFMVGLLERTIAIGVAPARAVAQRVLAPAALNTRIVRLATGGRVDLEDLALRLTEMGFEREAMVAEVGTFSVRGGIVDVFSYRYSHPVRIELADDEIASIRSFDLATQRSVESLDRVEILPARERTVSQPADESDEASAASHDLKPVADYLHPDCVIVVDEPERVKAALENGWEEVVRRYGEADDDRSLLPPDELYLDPAGVERSTASFRRLDVEALHMIDPGGGATATRFATREPEPIQRSVPRLIELLRGDLAGSVQPVILCDNWGQLERLAELLPTDLGAVTLDVGALNGGFVDGDAGLAVYTDHEIFARRRRPRRRRRYASAPAELHLTEVAAGDFLVHLDYGVGRYTGLERLRLADHGEVEALRLEYDAGEVLYVPVEQIGQVEKFSSPEGTVPSLHRLSSPRWERQKARTRAAIAELTEELLQLHAKRELAPGFGFSADTDWQRDMEAAFVYEDTPDQRAATDAVKRDMERPRPMDRLICGDVGYGKTEVAIRAAFKAVQDGKQVAVLAPTTVLAAQHLETFGERLADYPVKIGMLSRFNTASENRAVIKELRTGGLDIVIGTHRLLSSDVAFADLGLIVVDEEQRFGVRHKERLRALKTSVDVVTLSATPIPRTMQMSLMGLREMSLIETPPRDRTPIVTWVALYDEELIDEAIRREVDRGGQVFFVHNRVQTIDATRRRLERLVPDLRLAVAHGQLPGHELETVMMRFFRGEIDVLVTTAIIESGLDVPTANTIIVDRADRFGLADLYQLRGRVGRSHHRAYCYLLSLPRRAMTRDAERRLKVIEEHTDLGAGYRIALHDLEMRGAGDLLGADQSGFIAAVGFETYLRLLEETVRDLKGEDEKASAPPELVFDADAYLPTEFVPDDQQKLALYRRLARLRDVGAIDDFAAELEDRYGPLPDPARHLCTAARFKALGTATRLERLRLKPHRARAELRWPVGVEPRLKAIRAAAGELVELTVQRVDPLHLVLAAPDYPTLLEVLEAGLRAWVPDSIVTC
jgi:transcription-repair coupling factor (superfamily II helicase)